MNGLTSEGAGVDGGDVCLTDPQPVERLAPEDVGRESLQGRVAVEGHDLEVVEPRVVHIRLRNFPFYSRRSQMSAYFCLFFSSVYEQIQLHTFAGWFK